MPRCIMLPKWQHVPADYGRVAGSTLLMKWGYAVVGLDALDERVGEFVFL